MMRFTIRQLLLCVAWLALVLAAYVSTGGVYSTILGVLSGFSLYFGSRLVRQWRTSSNEIPFLTIVFTACALATAIEFYNMILDARALALMSSSLQSEVAKDPRFTNVTVNYSGSSGLRALNVGGYVSSRQDYNALRAMADDNFWSFKCDVRWNTTVATTAKSRAGG
jgi:hypothetical protein